MSILKIKDGNNNLIEIPTHAIETPILDLSEYYDSENVEGALREIGEKIRNGVATPDDIELLIKQIDNIKNNMEIVIRDEVELYLKTNNIKVSVDEEDVKRIVEEKLASMDLSGLTGLDTDTLKIIIQKYKDGTLGSGGGIDEVQFHDLLNSQLNVSVVNEMTEKYLNGELSGSGSGAVSPTIESSYPTESVIEEGARVDIDVFFQTPNLGEGTGYITVNGIEIDYYPTLQQGDNNIRIENKYITKTTNTIVIYVKDRVGMTSNKLTFKVISGGISLTTTFDYTVDYVVGQNILFPFYTTTELSGEITLEIVIDGIGIDPIVCSNGYNSLYLNKYITGVGVHAIKMQAFIGDYHSKVLNFNVVISSSTQLIISTDLLEGSKFEYGNPVQMAYRISKLGSEVFTVEFYIDEILIRTSNVQTGNYYWTISGTQMGIGIHKLDIIAYGVGGDRASVSVNIEIISGEFSPIMPVDQGMVCFLDSDGYSNEQQNREIWLDKSGNGHNGELINFNFGTNGWSPIVAEVDDNGNEVSVKYNGLVCNNDAYVRIPYKPFLENIINGYTMEIVYTPEHSGNDLARVLEYVDHDSPYTGIFVDINEANIKSESETSMGTVDLDYESGEIQLDFVVDRENKMCRMYVNGIVSRYWMLSDSGTKRENFAIDTDYIYINFSGLSEEYCGGTNIIRKFICYERALTHDEVVQNLIANQPDLVSMQQMYKWNYETQIPKLYIYGDISKCSSTNPSYVRVKFESPDSAKYGESFDMESSNTPFYLQGTSSLGYSRKNYRFVLMDSNGKEFFHQLNPSVLAESTFTLKCDYVDSSMCCNVCCAQIANDAVYGKGFTPAQKDNASRRTAIYGHAIELINVVDNEQESLGAYMFNVDRYATKNMGYDNKAYPNILCFEGESNSDVGSSAFFSYSNPQSSGNQFANEIAYHNEGWRAVYPSINEDAYNFAPIKRLVDFVSDSSDDDFKDSFEQYFNKESVLKYYLFDMFIGGIDGLSKNFHLCSWDGQIFYVLPYDMDSVLGGTNTGYLRVPSSAEVGTLYDTDGTTILEENHFNSWNSKLWSRVRSTFSVDLTNMYKTLRSNGLFTLENILSYFEEVWTIIPPKMYNDSQQIKYINDGAVGMVALHGNRKLQIKKWLRERQAYLDSKFGYYAGGGVGENYCNFRMNYQGAVSIDISTYYTVYAKVRWATNNEQTIRIAKGQTKTFSYYSDVSTDREVMIFLPESLKTIENISNIYPNSIDVSKATKLTKIEAHNTNLFSVDLSKNKYLRKIDFNGCTSLGTETATMPLNYCKYLNYVDLRGTQLTAVTFNTKGGSLREIYFPKTVQSINLINQSLLTDMILPYGEDGSNAPVDLATINIENCPNIERMIDLASNPSSLDGMKYCRNMTLNNSIKLSTINFNGFTRLANVNLQNMETLKEVDFLNLTEVGQVSSLRYIGVSACPKLTNISMNCDNSNYEITWASGSILDLQTSGAVKEVESNCIIKGLETIILPKTIEGLYFTNEYGSGYSDVKNIWSAEACTVTKTGVYPVAYHLSSEDVVDEYVGIDFRGLHLLNIDLGALVNIPEAINFSLYPTHVNPNFNLYRNGTTLPYLQPEGTLDLSDYTGSLAKFFNGVDFDKLTLVCSKTLEQTDYSYCFYNSTFSSTEQLMPLISKIGNAQNLSYMFYKTTIDTIAVLDSIALANNNIIYDYCFGECQNITNTDDLVLSAKVISAIGMFYKCPNLTSASYVQIKVNGSISKIFSDCKKLSNIDGMTIENVKDTSYMFNNDARISKMLEKIPSSCNNANYMYANTNISECEFVDVPFGSSTCTYEGFISGASGMTVRLKFTSGNPSAIGGMLTDTNNMIVDITELNMRNHSDFSNWFKDKTALREIIVENVIWSIGNINLSNAFSGCTNLKSDIVFPLNTVNVSNCYLNCTSLKDVHSNWLQTYSGNITPNNCYYGCYNAETLDGVYVKTLTDSPLDECPVIWGGYGFFSNYTGIYEIKVPSDNFVVRITNTMDDGSINWGDGSPIEKYGVVDYDITQSAYDDKWITHTYASAGTYTIKGKTFLSCRKHYGMGYSPEASLQESLRKIIQIPNNISSGQGISNPYCLMSAFRDCYNLEYADMTNINTGAMYLSQLFSGCINLKTLLFNVSFTHSSLTLQQVFRNCYKLKIDLENLPKFPNCNQINWGTMFNGTGRDVILEDDDEMVLDLRVMFPYENLESPKKVTDGFGSTFNECGATKIILPNNTSWKGGITDGRSFVRNCPNLTYLDLNKIQLTHQDFRGFIADNPKLETIDFTGVKIIAGDYLQSAFSGNTVLKNIIVGEGEYVDFTDTITDYVQYREMFSYCSEIEDLSMFKFKGTSTRWWATFRDCPKLVKLPTLVDDNGNITKTISANMHGCDYTFYNCKSLVDISEYTIIRYSQSLFQNCENLIHIGRLLDSYGNNSDVFNGCKKLTTIDELELDPGVLNGDTMSAYHETTRWFQNCILLTNVNFTGSSQPCYNNQAYWQHPPLSRESILSLFNALSNAVAVTNIGATTSITLNRNSYSLLSSSDIAIATNKGWTILKATS